MMKIYPNADLEEKKGLLVTGQEEDVQQELDTYVELGQRRGRGTQVSIAVCWIRLIELCVFQFIVELRLISLFPFE